MKNNNYLLVLLFPLFTWSPFGLTQEQAMMRGQEILLPFKQNLMQALQSGLQEGPVAAMGVCSLQAPAIATAISTNGIQVGRTSHKLRNPANASPDWAKPLLQSYLDNENDRQPHVVSLGNGRNGYVEPIIVQPLCLACHGENLSQPVIDKLQALYPEDQATGFAQGELRGLFWAEFPRD